MSILNELLSKMVQVNSRKHGLDMPVQIHPPYLQRIVIHFYSVPHLSFELVKNFLLLRHDLCLV